MLAKNAPAPRLLSKHALPLTFFASKLAPTEEGKPCIKKPHLHHCRRGFLKRRVGWLSGKKRPLLAAPPLRTVRASFPAYSSSLCKPSRMGEPAVSSLLTLGWIWIVAVGVPGADLSILTMD